MEFIPPAGTRFNGMEKMTAVEPLVPVSTFTNFVLEKFG